MTWWWLTCNSFTVAVGVYEHSGIVAEGPPIVGRFIGQPATNLGRWMRKIGGFDMRAI